MRIAILGTGAMGSLFGARLGRAGHDLLLIEVNPAQVAAINRDGLRLEDDDGSAVVHAPAGPAGLFGGAVDLMIVFTKSYHTISALREAAHLVSADTALLSLQNGLGAIGRMAEAFPGTALLHGMTNWPADLSEPGKIISHGAGEVRLWAGSEQHAAMALAIADVLDRAGLAATADQDIAVKIWEKVLFNAVMNPVSALTRLNVGGMAATADGRALAQAILGEGIAVALAERIPIDPARISAAVDHAYAHHQAHNPSMLSDVLAGRKTEIDAIVGELVVRAHRARLATPVLETLLRLVRMTTS